MSAQLTSKNAVAKIGVTTVTHLKSATVRSNKTVIQDHDIAGGAPAVLEPYEYTYEVELEDGYVDGTISGLVDTETPDVVIYPDGVTAGKPRLTAGSCVISYELGIRSGAMILERLRGPAKTLVVDTVPA